MLLEISGEITPERMKGWSQSKNNTQLWMTGTRSKVQCCKEQYCIGTWNVKSMNQDKLEIVKQEMARMNVDILEIRNIKHSTLFFNQEVGIYCVTQGAQPSAL